MAGSETLVTVQSDRVHPGSPAPAEGSIRPAGRRGLV